MSCETLFLGILYILLPLFKGSPPCHYSYLTCSTEVAGPLSSLLHSCLEAPAPTYALIPAGNSRVEAGPGSLPSPPPLTVPAPWSQCEGGGPAVLGNKRGSANLAKLPRSDQQWKNELIASSLYRVTEVSFHRLWLWCQELRLGATRSSGLLPDPPLRGPAARILGSQPGVFCRECPGPSLRILFCPRYAEEKLRRGEREPRLFRRDRKSPQGSVPQEKKKKKSLRNKGAQCFFSSDFYLSH